MSEPDLQKMGEHGEIVIVRRGNRGEDCHHGGVWKVAFADFMTAMMAFFLVMWLVNAANEETKVQVASYFNPVKLVDSTTNPRGLKEEPKSSSGDVENRKLSPEARAKAAATGETAETETSKTRKKGPVSYFTGGDIPESEMFRDPVRTLERIAGGAPDLLAGSDARRKPDVVGMEGGDAFRDPFSPRAWDMLVDDLPEEEAATTGGERLDRRRPDGAKDTSKKRGKPITAARVAAAPAAKGKAQRKETKRGSRVAETGNETTTARARAGNAVDEAQGRAGPAAAPKVDEAVLARRIEKALKHALARMRAGRRPVVTVRRTGEGILISVSDRAGFGMFRIGSAKPLPETVRFMEKVGAVLRSMPGEVIVRGHTDARPYRGGGYDNWMLSTARAHMARYMLLRGGLPEGRIERVEGVADRQPAVPDNPLDARNRRIEILLRPPRRATDAARGSGKAERDKTRK